MSGELRLVCSQEDPLMSFMIPPSPPSEPAETQVSRDEFSRLASWPQELPSAPLKHPILLANSKNTVNRKRHPIHEADTIFQKTVLGALYGIHYITSLINPLQYVVNMAPTEDGMHLRGAGLLGCSGDSNDGNSGGTSLFLPAVNYAAGKNPSSVAIADFDGNGWVDLAVANHDSNNVSVFFNDGTFADAVNYATGRCLSSVAVADLNGDGKPDLATANGGCSNVGSVSVLLNNGSGVFAGAVNYATGNSPRSIVVADLNGDGKPDLVVANQYSDNVSVLLNNGSGIFADAVNYAAGTEPESVRVGDLNGDGKPDLVVTNRANDKVSVLLNNGSGIFAGAVSSAVGRNPSPVVIRDLNGDGRPDLAVANGGSDSVSVLIHR